MTGHGFWNSFGDSISENWVDAVITSFAFTAVTVAASNLVQTRCCFKEGTLVETSEGLKPIEEIEVGDEVLAYDEETGTQAYKPVVRLFRNETKVWYHIYVNGEEIICTGGHPFYVIDAAENTRIKGKWITASELEICDKLLLSDGTYAIIQSIGIEALVEPETTYNFEVADSHTYYVSKSNVLVHNKCTTGERNKAVKDAWKEEQRKALNGEDLSQEWSPSELNELKANGKVKGYEGHHMKSVKGYPELAGDSTNIQFLKRTDHLLAHNGNWRNITHGRYFGG